MTVPLDSISNHRRAMALPLVMIMITVFLIYSTIFLRRGVTSKSQQSVDLERIRAEFFARGLFQLVQLKTSILHSRSVDAVKWHFGIDPFGFQNTVGFPDLKFVDNSHRNYFRTLLQNINSSPTGINFNNNPYNGNFAINLNDSRPISRSQFGNDVEEYSLKIVVDVDTPAIVDRTKTRTFKLDTTIKLRK